MDTEKLSLILDDLDRAPLLVVIRREMSEELQRHVDPEDLLQETLQMAWRDRAHHVWTDPMSFRRWLLEIARNRIRDTVDRWRARKRGGGAVASGVDAEPIASTTPSRSAMLRERANQMDQALRSLPPEHEVLVRAHLFDQTPMTEVARQLDINLATAWSRFRRGAEAYREELRRRLSLSASQQPH